MDLNTWLSLDFNKTSIDQYSSGLKCSISFSLSHIILSATDWTLPADLLPGSFRHKIGDKLNPTR